MRLSSDKMQKLMAYVDGELDGADRIEVEKILAKDADAMRFVEQVAGLGGILKEGHEDRDAKAVAAFDVADVVMAAVNETKATKVVSLDAARAKRGSGGTKVAGGILAALALAAGVFFFARPPAETPMGVGVAQNEGPGAVATGSVTNPSGPGVEVRTLQSPGETVSVFYLPSAANELSTSVVVWVDETAEKK